MSEERELVPLKQDIVVDYIDKYLDRLLELRYKVKNATSVNEIVELMQKEQDAIAEFKPVSGKKNVTKTDAAEQENSPPE